MGHNAVPASSSLRALQRSQRGSGAGGGRKELGGREEPHNIPQTAPVPTPPTARRPRTAARAATWRLSPQRCRGFQQPGRPQDGTNAGAIKLDGGAGRDRAGPERFRAALKLSTTFGALSKRHSVSDGLGASTTPQKGPCLRWTTPTAKTRFSALPRFLHQLRAALCHSPA